MKERQKVLVTKLEVTDLIRAIAAHDPIRENPEYARLLALPWDEYEKEVQGLETEEK